MTGKPVVYETTHRIAFSELDPFQHLNTGSYARTSPTTAWRGSRSTPAGTWPRSAPRAS